MTVLRSSRCEPGGSARLFEALTNVPDVDFGFTDLATDIVLSAPDSDIPAAARLSIYLYRIEPDAAAEPARALRRHHRPRPRAACAPPPLPDHAAPRRRGGQPARPRPDPAGAPRPALDLALTARRSTTAEAAAARRCACRSADDAGRHLPRLARHGSDYRLSVAYVMRTVMVDSALDPVSADRVSESHILVGQGAGR